MFYPTDQENKDSTRIIEVLGFVSGTRWVQELLEPKKDIYPLMSESGSEYSWDGSSDDLKDALIGLMAVNDLSDSAFASVTSQLQAFYRIVMSSADAIRYMDSNDFLDQPTTNKEMNDKKKILFHYFPEELHITAIMCAVQEAPTTRQLKTNAMERHCNTKQERDNMVKREVSEKATDEFIQCII